ncbi:uncharacterized protein LOC120337793 [Styela clava]
MDNYRLHDAIVKDLLLEVIEEEILGLLENSIIEDEHPIDPRAKEKNMQKLTQYFADDILNKVLAEEFVSISTEFFDMIIKNHRTDVTAVQRLNDVLRDTTKEITEEIVLELMEEKNAKSQCEKIVDDIITEVLAEEFNIMSSKTLDHYRARVALLQYRQMQSSASGVLLDKVILNALLSPYNDETEESDITLQNNEKDNIMNKIIFELVLSQSLALHACFPKNTPMKNGKDLSLSKLPPTECIPLNWYKKKVTSAIAEDVAVTMLCDRLDESMQFAAEEQMKNQAVSLFSQFINAS